MVTFLSPYLLSSQGDRPAMAHSVEGRYPFLDYRVVEFCGRLPASMKQRGLREKWLLRKLARRMLPQEIWQRTKQPYRAPIQRTFFPAPAREEAYVGELLSADAIRRSGYFRPEAVERLVMKARSGERLGEVEEMALTGILSTQLVEEWFVRKGRAAPLAGRLAPLKLVEEPALAASPAAGAGMVAP
jgi:asparagine synthase (glutamine-hydrolysing)